MKAEAHHMHVSFPAAVKTQGGPPNSELSENAFRCSQRVFLSQVKLKVRSLDHAVNLPREYLRN